MRGSRAPRRDYLARMAAARDAAATIGRTLAAPEPAVTDAALLSDAGLVLEHQAQALAGMCSGNRPQALTEPP